MGIFMGCNMWKSNLWLNIVNIIYNCKSLGEYLWDAICGNVGGTFVGSGDLRRNGDGFGL